MIQNWTERSQVFIVALIISIVTIFLGWFFGGWLLTAGLIFTVFSIITLARHIWLSDKSNFLVRMAWIALLGAATANTWLGWNLVTNIILQFFPHLKIPLNSPDPVMLGFLLIVTIIIFNSTKEKDKQTTAQKPIDKLVEGLTIKQKWENVCEGLKSQIRDIDRDTNWSNEYYTPLDAEVEMKTSKGIKRVIADLLGAIKKSNDRLFLLIGEPGSGKSVALRKLCLDLLKDSVKKEYIPIYVNLKEWESDKDWSKNPPTWQDLEAFVKESLQNKDRHLADFFEKYYDVLDENGNLFFVLDSFDEIPQVLGTNANSKLITDLTKVCREFLVGAKQPRSRGILASREHRMPHEEYLDNCTILRVRPFTHEKIELTLTQAGKMGADAVAQLFRSRPDLTPILRNPFMTSLLQSYLANNESQLPQNQAELYANYIKKSIQQAQKRLGKESISFEEIHEQAVKMATAIFSSDSLQAPLEELRQVAAHPKFDDIIQVLRFTRIARGNINSGNLFSFSHRRFYEYFVVCDWVNSPEFEVPIDSIPTDSKWRDALILYCGVAPLNQVKKIVSQCTIEVFNAESLKNIRAKHSLKFLAEALRGRTECLEDYKDEFGHLILKEIHQDNNPIVIISAVEALGILDKKYIDQGAFIAFGLWDSYINEVALRSCRHLDSISDYLEEMIILTIDNRFSNRKKQMWKTSLLLSSSNAIKIGMSSRELLFSLSLSEAFKNIKHIVLWKQKEEWMLLFNSVMLVLFLILGMIFMTILEFFPKTLEKYAYFMIYSFCISIGLVFINFMVVEPILRKKHFAKNNKFINTIPFFPTIDFMISRKGALMSTVVILIMAIISSLVSIFYNISFLYSIHFVAIGIMLLTTPFLMAAIYFITKEYIRKTRNFNAIDYSKLNQREYIAHVLQTNDWYFYQIEIIAYIENNINEAYGEFPIGFLKVGQGSLMSRLIHLEEKWREVEEKKQSL